MKRSLLSVLGFFICAAAFGQEPYGRGVPFPRPTPYQLDSLLALGVVPNWLNDNPTLYWPRSKFTVAARASWRTYMTQAIDAGPGLEADIAIPLGPTDFGLFLYARANNYTVRNNGWLDWDVHNGETGVLFNGGIGASFALPLYNPGFNFPLGMSVGPAFFQPRGSAAPAETYLGFEPSVGVRYRANPTVSMQWSIAAAYMVPLREGNRAIGSWNFSFGVELALASYRREPLQKWVPPLVVTAHDVIMLLGTEPDASLDIFDRSLDFINTEVKPLTGLGWYPLGFRGIVRGTVVASSRAASGNVTAVDVQLDSADLRGFRVWRNAILLDPGARNGPNGNNEGDSTFLTKKEKLVLDRIKRGDYSYRSNTELGRLYLRAELFPEAKGNLDKVPRTGSRVEIAGELWWDGDGHLEIHPRRPSDVRLISGEFLDSDDESILE
jgi:hypothetical protein